MQSSTITAQILRSIVTASLLTIATSCEKEIKMNIKDTPPVLVANTLAEGGQPWNVEISASQFILDSGSAPLLDDAVATIRDVSGTAYTMVNQGAGHYTLPDKMPLPGETYIIEVSHRDYPTVTARCEIPMRPVITSVEHIGIVKDDNSSKYRLRIHFLDPAGENFYQFRFVNTSTYSMFIQGYDQTDTAYMTDTTDMTDSVVTNSYLVYYNYGNTSPYKDQTAGCISDQYFNGTEAAIDIDIDEYNIPYPYESNITLTVAVESLSEDFYRYLLTYSAYRSDAGPMAQPVHVYSNVSGGLGIVGGHAYSDPVNVQRQ